MSSESLSAVLCTEFHSRLEGITVSAPMQSTIVRSSSLQSCRFNSTRTRRVVPRKNHKFNGEVLIQSARTAMVVRPVCRWETRQLLSHLFRTYLGASLSVASDSDFDGSTIAILPECGRVILQPFGRYHSRALARNTKRTVYVMTVFDA